MIDVHVLTHSGTRADWLDQCLESLARENCTVHVVQGTEGHIGKGRAKGFQLGAHEFVSYVDSDDYVLPGVMDACLEALTKHRSVVTNEQLLNGSGMSSAVIPGHHLDVYRRCDVEPLLARFEQTPNRGEKAMKALLRPTPIEFIGYVWRNHSNGAHLWSATDPDWQAA